MFALARKEGEGTWRNHLEGMLKRARTPERRAEIEAQLAVPALPPAIAYLWRIFMRLHARRQSTGMGPARVGWTEIDAFVRLTGARLSAWEIGLLERLDDVALAESTERSMSSNGTRPHIASAAHRTVPAVES